MNDTPIRASKGVIVGKEYEHLFFPYEEDDNEEEEVKTTSEKNADPMEPEN